MNTPVPFECGAPIARKKRKIVHGSIPYQTRGEHMIIPWMAITIDGQTTVYFFCIPYADDQSTYAKVYDSLAKAVKKSLNETST